jgi:nucleotide-binding universal stress UspA family protein
MKNIIVPTDFSPASVNAAYYAAELALNIQADIVLLHALPLPITVSEVPLPPDSYKLSEAEAQLSLKELQQKLETHTNDKVCITCRVTTDSFAGEIENFNKKPNIFAMVMGTSGAGATEAFFLGSFSLTAARHFTHPLIVVPPGCTFQGIHKIGLACDMHNVLETVPFPAVKALFKQFDAKLEILYISKPGEKMYPQVLIQSKFMQDHLVALHPEIRITTNEDIKAGLEDFVQKSGIELLILVPKERNFVERIFHKSVTENMVLQAAVPVLILH